MMKKFLVVDQNYLRCDELAERLESDRGLVIVFPDIALLEMLKSDKWKSTMKGSLLILSRYPRRVHVSISIGVAIKREIREKRSSNGGLIDREVTKWFRELLNEVAADVEGEKTKVIADRILAIQQQVAIDELDHVSNKLRLEKIMSTLEPPVLSKGTIKRLRSGKITEHERREIISTAAPFVLEIFFQQADFLENKKKSFLKQKPAILRYTYSRLWLCLSWIARGGFEAAKGTTITNDVIDQEYVITATFFDGILSKEKRVSEAFVDLSGILA